jgi:hypothetical protein
MITVMDNFFRADLSTLIAKGTESYQWCYHHKSVMKNPIHNKFFVSHLWYQSCEENFFHLLWKLIKREIPDVANCVCRRIIANGQVKGQNGNWHTDYDDKTVLYFPLEWEREWGGSVHFKIAEVETEIHYKQNRLVIFDSNTLHYGAGPTVDNIFRVSIAFNLRADGSLRNPSV